MKPANTVKFHLRYCRSVARLNNPDAGMLFRAVMNYVRNGVSVSFTCNCPERPAAVKTVALMNTLYAAMCDDIDADRDTFAERKQGRIGGAVDGVVFREGYAAYACGVHHYVVLTRGEYDELVDQAAGCLERDDNAKYTPEELVNGHIQLVDRAAQKTGNAQGWSDWLGVLQVAIGQDWAGMGNYEYCY